jgi:hypothetical protein
MPLPRAIEIHGRRYVWHELVALRRTQATPRIAQPSLFELQEDHRPPGERNAAERYEHRTCSPCWSGKTNRSSSPAGICNRVARLRPHRAA